MGFFQKAIKYRLFICFSLHLSKGLNPICFMCMKRIKGVQSSQFSSLTVGCEWQVLDKLMGFVHYNKPRVPAGVSATLPCEPLHSSIL